MKKVLSFVLCVFVGSFFSCKTSSKKLQEDKKVLPLSLSDEETVKLASERFTLFYADKSPVEDYKNITKDLWLPSVGDYDTSVFWESSQRDLINENSGKVTRVDSFKRSVELTALFVTKTAKQAKRVFNLEVAASTKKEQVASKKPSEKVSSEPKAKTAASTEKEQVAQTKLSEKVSSEPRIKTVASTKKEQVAPKKPSEESKEDSTQISRENISSSVGIKISQVLITQVAAGYYHSILLDDKGGVYTFGAGGDGQLGHGDQEEQLSPKKIESLDDIRITQIAAGYHHSILLDDKGEVYTFGWGSNGQLGHGDSEDQLSPKKIESLAGVRIAQIAAGDSRDSYSILLDDKGGVYTFGNGEYGQLGHGDKESQLSPKKIESLDGIRITQIAAGGSHSILLDDKGGVYTFGEWIPRPSKGDWTWSDAHFQLTPKKKFEVVHGTKKTDFFDGIRITQIAAGSEHSIFLDDKGGVYTFGSGVDGLLGHGDEDYQFIPKKIESLDGIRITQIVAGYHHSIVLDDKGGVYTFGHLWFGQLGHGYKTTQPLPYRLDYLSPKKIESLDGIRITQSAAGGFNSIVLDDKGGVYTFGKGEEGQLGHGDSEDQLSTKKID